MQPELRSLSCEPISAAGTLILGDGTAPGLVIVPRSLLRQICAQMDHSATVAPSEQSGLLLGPEPQGEDLLVEGAIPLDGEYRFARSLAILLAGVESVHPMLAEAEREQSHTIVGLYRILAADRDEAAESCLEFLAANGQERSSLSRVRCCFVFAPLSGSETSLRVLMRKGERWQQIQEITLHSEPSSAPITPTLPPIRLKPLSMAWAKRSEQPRLAGNAIRNLKNFHLQNRFWVDVAIVTLLLLLLAADTLLIWFVRRVPRETTNLQPLTDQIGELRAAVSELRLPQATPVHLDPPPTKAPPGNADVPRKQVSNQPPTASRMAIAKKPTVLRPAEAFQFRVNGNPPPKVVWSSEGPGSIDSVYGLYRAPDRFTGETKVKVTATSWAGSQSVTFTLQGAAKDGK